MQTFKKGGPPIDRVEKRKVRNDKKKDIKPTIKIDLKDAIYRLAFITRTPVKNVCEYMINYSIKNAGFIDRLVPFFIRDILINETVFKGSLDNPHYERFETGKCERIHFRLSQAAHDKVSIFAYALDLNPSRICAIMLNDCIHDFKFLNSYTSQFLQNELSYHQMTELKEMIKYITKNVNVEASVASFLSVIVHEVAPTGDDIRNTVDDFIIHNWREKK